MNAEQLITRYPHRDYLVVAGLHYGYPLCCIKAFLMQNERGQGWAQREKEVIRVLHDQGHGFVPCVKHARMILAGKATFASLIRNRTCPTPFPVDEYTGKVIDLDTGEVVDP